LNSVIVDMQKKNDEMKVRSDKLFTNTKYFKYLYQILGQT
jgi:hypothetical protein